MPARKLFPGEVLLAVLHRVGAGTRIAEDSRLVQLFDEAAREDPELFGPFAKHPFYPDSDGLTDALQALDLGSAIVRENAATGYFTVGARTRGEYGAGKFALLNESEQARVSRLAERISQMYDRAEEPSLAAMEAVPAA